MLFHAWGEMVLVNNLMSISSMVWLFFLLVETFPLVAVPDGVPVGVPPVMLLEFINGLVALVLLAGCWLAEIPRIGEREFVSKGLT